MVLAGNNKIAGSRYGGDVKVKSGFAISDSFNPATSGADRDGVTTVNSGSNLHSHYMNRGQGNDGRTSGFQINPKRLTTAQSRQNNYTATGIANVNAGSTTFGGNSDLG